MTRRGPGSALYELMSSMRFAVSLLTVLAVASIVGTVLRHALRFPRRQQVSLRLASYGEL